MRVRIPSVTFKAILRKRIRFDGFIKEKPQHFMKMPASLLACRCLFCILIEPVLSYSAAGTPMRYQNFRLLPVT